MEIYVVGWSFTDMDEPQNSSAGLFTDIFKTKEAARKAIFDDAETIASDELGAYDDAEAVALVGTSDPKELAKKMLRRDDGMYLELESGLGVTRYCITKYDTKYTK